MLLFEQGSKLHRECFADIETCFNLSIARDTRRQCKMRKSSK